MENHTAQLVVLNRNEGFLNSNLGWSHSLETAKRYSYVALKNNGLPTDDFNLSSDEIRIVPVQAVKPLTENLTLAQLLGAITELPMRKLCDAALKILNIDLTIKDDGVYCSESDRLFGFIEIKRILFMRLMTVEKANMTAFFNEISPNSIVKTRGKGYYFIPFKA